MTDNEIFKIYLENQAAEQEAKQQQYRELDDKRKSCAELLKIYLENDGQRD